MARKKALRRKQAKREVTPEQQEAGVQAVRDLLERAGFRTTRTCTEDPDVIKAEFEELEKQGP